MKLMLKAMAKAMNFMVKKFLAKKLTILLAYAPKSMAANGEGSAFAVLDWANFSAAAIAASCRAPRSSAGAALKSLVRKMINLIFRL